MKQKMMILVGVITLLWALSFLSFAQNNDPHKGQPKKCHNYPKGKKHPNCYCKLHCNEKGEPTGQEDSKCSVYCRKNDCHCERSCDS